MTLLTILSAAFLVYQLYLAFNINRTEQLAYDVDFHQGNIELRNYEPTIEASVTTYGDFKSVSTYGFRVLANYIFGGNSHQQKISMTAPVKMIRNNDGSASMSFFMPGKFHNQDLPNPYSREISFSKNGSFRAAVILFGGFASENRMLRKKKELEQFLQNKGMEFEGHVAYLRYNPPFQLIGRRNEVLIKLTHDNQTDENIH